MTIRPLGTGRPSDPEIHLLTGARALGAVDVAEARSFDDHLADCPTCAEEYRSLVETAAVLGSAEAASAPRALRRRVLQDVSHTRQLPPEVTSLQGRRPVWRRPVTWLAAAAAAAVIATGTTLVVTQSDGTRTAAEMQECVASAPDTVTSTPTVGSGGDIRWAASCQAAVVQLPEMGTLPADADFEVWQVDATGAHSVAIAKKSADGSIAPAIVTIKMTGTDKSIAVTKEKAGGSSSGQPTSAPIWQVEL